MKVNAWKNIDVECEVEVSLDDCIHEMLDMANSEDGMSRKYVAVDGATRILAALNPQELLQKGNVEQVKKLLRERLAKWIEFLADAPEIKEVNS